MLHRSLQENSNVSQKYFRPKPVWSKNRAWQADRDRKTNSLVLNLMLNSISKLTTILKANFFLQLSATIPTFDNNIFLKILSKSIVIRYFEVASAHDGWAVTDGQKSNVKNQIPQSFPILLGFILFYAYFWLMYFQLSQI